MAAFNSDALTNTHTRTIEFAGHGKGGRGVGPFRPPGARATKGSRGPHWADPSTRGAKPEPRNSYAVAKARALEDRKRAAEGRRDAEAQGASARFKSNPVATHIVPRSRTTAFQRTQRGGGGRRTARGSELRSPGAYLPAYSKRREDSVFNRRGAETMARRHQEEDERMRTMARQRDRAAAAAAAEAARGDRLGGGGSSLFDPGAEFDAQAKSAEGKRRAAFLRSTLPDGRITGESLGLTSAATSGLASTIAAESVLESFGERPTLADTAALCRALGRGGGGLGPRPRDDAGFRPSTTAGRLRGTGRLSSSGAEGGGATVLGVTSAGTVLRRTTASRRGERPPPVSPVKGGRDGAVSLGGTVGPRPETAPRTLSKARASAAGVGSVSVEVSPVRTAFAGSPTVRGGLSISSAALGGRARAFVDPIKHTTVQQPAPTAAVMDSGAVARGRRSRMRGLRDACR